MIFFNFGYLSALLGFGRSRLLEDCLDLDLLLGKYEVFRRITDRSTSIIFSASGFFFHFYLDFELVSTSSITISKLLFLILLERCLLLSERTFLFSYIN